jgi:hypothetical protein
MSAHIWCNSHGGAEDALIASVHGDDADFVQPMGVEVLNYPRVSWNLPNALRANCYAWIPTGHA